MILVLAGCLPELPILEDPCGEFPSEGPYVLHVDTPDGRRRKAIVDVPPGEGPRDIAVAMHGAVESANEFRGVTELHRRSVDADEPWVSAFPQGRGTFFRVWNAGTCCGSVDEQNDDVDDVGFLELLAKTLRERTCGRDVAALGFSNGAMMAHRWGCEGDQVDAVVAVAGPLMTEPPTCEGPARPVLHVHGLADTHVPFDGGPSSGPGGNIYPPMDETLNLWRTRNACSNLPDVEIPVGLTTCFEADCATPTGLCTIEGWDHRWPGGIHAGGTALDQSSEAMAWMREALGESTEPSR